jgi:hypothetical protein
MSLGVLVVMKKNQGYDETRLIHGGGLELIRGGDGGEARTAKDPDSSEWAMKALLGEVLQSSPAMDPERAELIYRRVVDKHRLNAERKRRWIKRMGRTVIQLMASVAGSRAFRILTQ